MTAPERENLPVYVATAHRFGVRSAESRIVAASTDKAYVLLKAQQVAESSGGKQGVEVLNVQPESAPVMEAYFPSMAGEREPCTNALREVFCDIGTEVVRALEMSAVPEEFKPLAESVSGPVEDFPPWLGALAIERLSELAFSCPAAETHLSNLEARGFMGVESFCEAP